MARRARAGSSNPEGTVEKLVEKARVDIPGDAEHRQHRVQGLGPLTGLVAGVGVGMAAGLLRATGFRPGTPAGIALTTAGVLIATNGPMTALGITDPRSWSGTDWLSDVVPHLAY